MISSKVVNGVENKKEKTMIQYPISALSLGLIEKRDPEKTTVSDIAYDIYLEEQVAKHAHELMPHAEMEQPPKSNILSNKD